MSIILYTQPKCPYCDIMKGLLSETGFAFYIINIQENANAKAFLKEKGHRTVPQVYVENIHINKKNTEEYTASELYQLLSNALSQEQTDVEWPWVDSGIEQGV